MTFLIAWIDELGGWLFGDSAASHAGAPSSEKTSFGELQLSDRGTVEEAVIKISRLPRNILAAVCGSARSAEIFLDLLSRNLSLYDEDTISILTRLTLISRDWDPFVIIFAEPAVPSRGLLLFSSTEGPQTTTTNELETCIAGSLGPFLRWQAAAGIAVIRKIDAPPETRQILAAAYLQSIGISNILPAEGVGGAFWSAQLSTTGECHWQDDVIYLIYSQISFFPCPSDMPESSQFQPDAMIRCLIRDDVAFTISSVRRKLSALVPLGCTQATLDAAQAKVEHPRRYVAATRYVAFLNSSTRRIVLIDRARIAEQCEFVCIYDNDLKKVKTTDISPPSRVYMFVTNNLRRHLEAQPRYKNSCHVSVLQYQNDHYHVLEQHIPLAEGVCVDGNFSDL